MSKIKKAMELRLLDYVEYDGEGNVGFITQLEMSVSNNVHLVYVTVKTPENEFETFMIGTDQEVEVFLDEKFGGCSDVFAPRICA